MADWTTISALATGGGTLVLAVATFASVRSANRSARIAEQALQEQRRPVLVQSRLSDPEQKIMFVDQYWVHVRGGYGAAVHRDEVVYLVMSLRNVGAGIGVCQGWETRVGLQGSTVERFADEDFRPQTRDLYIPAGDVGVWQGALRDPADPRHREIVGAIDQRQPISIELLYSDQVGGQRTVSRFHLTPVVREDDTVNWLAYVGRHWYLEGLAPR
jgi:hypothetical protein